MVDVRLEDFPNEALKALPMAFQVSLNISSQSGPIGVI